MGDVTVGEPLAEIRALLTRTVLAPEDRARIVAQARAVIDGLYVHRDQKRALYGADPAPRLEQLARQAADMPDADLHAGLLEIFHDLHDGHTYYLLPRPYLQTYLSLGFLVERCTAAGDGKDLWLVTHVRRDVAGPDLPLGAELTHWNGTPIAVAVARHAAVEWGSNPAARTARGLESMTQRWLGRSAVPDEDWVELGFLADGSAKEARLPWRLVTSAELIDETDDAAPVVRDGRPLPVALDRQVLAVQRMKRVLFAGADATGGTASATEGESFPQEIPTGLPTVRARAVQTPSGVFGHLRIYSFGSRIDPDAFLDAVAAVLPLLPQDGLIVDVRGNGGGLVESAEGLIQMLTPRRVEPATFQFRITESTAELVRAAAGVDTFAPWTGGLDEALDVGAQYSPALPLNSPDRINDRGQLYHGPVVLVVDALSYSATDILAAGFQDHAIGPVLGTDDATGAGGASVFTASSLRKVWPGSPLAALARDADMGVALLRALRVGPHLGRPIEDIGVRPDELHRPTPQDVLTGNVDLLARAGALLAAMPSARLDVAFDGPPARLHLDTKGVTSVDVFAAGRPVTSVGVADGATTIDLAGHDPATTVIRVAGYRGTDLVAGRTLTPPR